MWDWTSVFQDAQSGSAKFDDPGHLEDKDTPALETLQDEGGASCDAETVQVQVPIPQEQCLDTEVESDEYFTTNETSVLDALHVAPSVTMQVWFLSSRFVFARFWYSN